MTKFSLKISFSNQGNMKEIAVFKVAKQIAKG